MDDMDEGRKKKKKKKVGLLLHHQEIETWSMTSWGTMMMMMTQVFVVANKAKQKECVCVK
jgi:hypothetical protein